MLQIIKHISFFYSIEIVLFTLGGYPQLLCLGHQWNHSWSFQVSTCAYLKHANIFLAFIIIYMLVFVQCWQLSQDVRQWKICLVRWHKGQQFFLLSYHPFRRYLQSPIVQPQTVFITLNLMMIKVSVMSAFSNLFSFDIDIISMCDLPNINHVLMCCFGW